MWGMTWKLEKWETHAMKARVVKHMVLVGRASGFLIYFQSERPDTKQGT